MSSPPRRRDWKRTARLVIGLVFVVLGMNVVLMQFENSQLFFPLKADEDWDDPTGVIPTVEDVALVSRDGTRLHAWWCPVPEGVERGAILYAHGNGGNLSHRAGVIAELQRHLRLPVLIVDYPGYGRSEGAPSERGCYAAGEAAYDWLTLTAGVPPERVILFGESLGGAVAVELAVRRPHRALVSLFTFTSVPDMARVVFPWLPLHLLVRNKFDNLAKIGRCPRPILIVHGDDDPIVPFAMGERLYAAAPEPKSFLRLPGFGHYLPDGDAFYRALQEFLDAYAPLPASR